MVDEYSIDLDDIQKVTIANYNNSAESFWEGTKDHDVSQNIAAFLNALPEDKPLDVLDFGCGPGRDVHAFKALGHNPVGLDGSQSFCEMARKHSACPVLHQQFLSLELEDNSFDGIFANASLFHVPSKELPRVLLELHAALRPNGILFTSNPRGEAEGWNGERYGHYMELEVSKGFLQTAGFEITHYYYRPEGLPCEQQPWLAIVSKALPLEA